MLGLAAMILAAASADASPALTSHTPWWEKVTYTIIGDSAQQSCQYESSIAGARNCDSDEASSPLRPAASDATTGTFTKITIERRFTPAGAPHPGGLEPGDTLLGGQIMALAIDTAGTVRGCKVLAASGDVRPAYGCDDVRAERFEASAGRATPEVRQAFMTIVVYGHEEQLA